MAQNKPKTDHLIATQFKADWKGGPGRPRKRPISEAYDEHLRLELPEKVRIAMQLPKGATWADAVAASMLRAAMKGDVAAAKELREGTEGKAPMRISAQIETSKRTEIVVMYDDAPTEIHEVEAIDVTPQLPESTDNKEPE